MTDNNVEKDILTIPVLDGTNYSEWSVRMTILLRSKELLDASYDAVNLITARVGHKVFIEVIKLNTTNSYLLWTKLKDQYASKKATNRGHVWMDLLRSSYQGNIQQYVTQSRKIILELESVGIFLAPDLLSFTILGKLMGDPKVHQYVELLTLNEDLVGNPDEVLSKLEDFHNNSALQEPQPISSASALVLESSEPFKITHYCANGKHNPKCNNHSKEECYDENPHLRPARRDKRRRPFSSQNASAHVSTAQALITGRDSSSSMQDLIIDCGATHHMFNNKNLFLSLCKINPMKVSTGDSSSTLSAIGLGTVKLICNEKPLILENSLFVPGLNCNLVSLLQLFDEKLVISRCKSQFTLESEGSVIIKGTISNNLMKVKYLIPQAFVSKINTHYWHQRLGHPGPATLKSMGLPSNTINCTTCDLNKAHLLPFKDHFEHVHLPLDCVHLDLVGPITPPSVSGYRYFLTIADQSTLFKITCFLKNKSDSFNEFLQQKIFMENLHDRKLKKLVSDRGGEFLNHKFKALSEKCGFQHIFSPAETPQHNGFAERANQSILLKTRCILNHSNLPKVYWAEAVRTATVLCNIVPTPSRTNRSPFSLWRGTPPRIKNIRTFGCQAIISLQKGHRDWKFGPSRNEGVLLGFENDNTSYRILRTLDKKIVITRHATFNEDIGELIIDWNSNHWPATVVDETHIAASAAVDELRADEQLIDTSRVVDEVHVSDEDAANADVPDPESCHPSNPRPRIKIIGPWHPTHITSEILEQNILPYSRRANALLTTSSTDPKTFRQALLSPNKEAWTEAINKELKSMASLNVWEVVDLDPGYRLIGTTWVFRTKRSHLGEIVEHKTRLCAQGFTQTAGVDYNKTYAPTGCFNSLRTLIAFAVTNSLLFHQIDIQSAFLNAPLNETVYLSIPQGLNLARDKHCLCLCKAIYGLKQAPLAWYNRLKSWLVSNGFVACVLDPCVFYRNRNHPLWLYVHVDDIAIFGTDVSSFKTEISEEFDIKDIGPADLMLGVKVTHLPNGISLDQQHFSDSLLFLYGMQDCRPVSTPLPPNSHYSPATKEEALEFKKLEVNYRSAIGSINYLCTATRPNLSHAVSSLSQFLENPGVTHWCGFLHVLRYLRGSPDVGLLYSNNPSQGITAYSDADWGNCRVSRQSVSGYLATLNGCLYKALCDLTSELLWLRQWVKECCLLSTITPIVVYEDNQSCINAANGDCNVNNKRMKHVDIQLHFIKEVIRSSAIRLSYTPTSSMLADFLTKSVPRSTLSRALSRLSVVQLGVRGDVENHLNTDQDDRHS
ncbi:hypothetical protein O181_065265 [Austropuccinia psidii MF-1]|uniref:Integrase catalytic domain-containing protein n=1 Tax=Austropuccinia psidii MF-1 TaxID=1389203 RepID=A0A9Q3I3X7_9BASI|nr:hypothetical protein [Austropuccinia psidii MF-1]